MTRLRLTLLVGALAAAVPACAHSTSTPMAKTAGTTRTEKTVTLLHIADTHAQLETHPEYMPGEEPAVSMMGGYARLRTALDRERAAASWSSRARSAHSSGASI